MSDQQFAELYERLVAGKKKETGIEYPFQRGWNAAVEWVIRQMRAVCDEKEMAE